HKVFPVDPGMIGAFDRSGRSNIGHALETVVLHELDRRRAEPGYVRTASGYEVDFLAQFRDAKEELIQVCADLSAPETADRECQALEEAVREHPRAARRLLTLNADPVSAKVPAGVTVQPAYQWLLDG